MGTVKEKSTISKKSTAREKNIETIRLFVSLIEQRDIPAFLNLFTNDGVQFNYFQSGMIPAEIRGKDELRKFWAPIPEKFSEMNFVVEAIYPMLDPGGAVVKYHGHTTLKASGKHYNNEYLALFFFDEDGKIKEYHEYSNPVVTARSFDMVDKIV